MRAKTWVWRKKMQACNKKMQNRLDKQRNRETKENTRFFNERTKYTSTTFGDLLTHKEEVIPEEVENGENNQQ